MANQYSKTLLSEEEKREHRRMNQAKWRAANPERNRKNSHEWEKKHPQRHLKSHRVRIWRSKGINLSYDQFLDMLAIQEYKCKICTREISTSSPVDHDHITGKLRGILCDACNRGIGLLGDNITVLENAIHYLKEYDHE